MFVFTAKFNKIKVIAVIVLVIAVICAIVILAVKNSGGNSSESAALNAIVKNNDERVAYLNALGWQVSQDPIEEQDIVIPREFSTVYENYNKLQLSQGFNLSKYGGSEATRYTYKITNYPQANNGNIVADIIVHRGEVIAGDIQSSDLNGFMEGLKYPGAAS